jgi:hypothetical protein
MPRLIGTGNRALLVVRPSDFANEFLKAGLGAQWVIVRVRTKLAQL